jgi:transposase-like protein
MWRLATGWVSSFPLSQVPGRVTLNMSLRRIIKTRGAFPSEEAGMKLLYLALTNVVKKWDTVQHWREAMARFTLLWEDRILAATQR